MDGILHWQLEAGRWHGNQPHHGSINPKNNVYEDSVSRDPAHPTSGGNLLQLVLQTQDQAGTWPRKVGSFIGIVFSWGILSSSAASRNGLSPTVPTHHFTHDDLSPHTECSKNNIKCKHIFTGHQNNSAHKGWNESIFTTILWQKSDALETKDNYQTASYMDNSWWYFKSLAVMAFISIAALVWDLN